MLNQDGSFWISDEYGPYVYRFNAAGIMVGAIRPVDAIIPLRNGTESFSANSPTIETNGKGDVVIPANNPTVRPIEAHSLVPSISAFVEVERMYKRLHSSTERMLLIKRSA